MSERPVVTVLLYESIGDSVAGGAVRELLDLAAAGFISPLWLVDIGHGHDREWSVRFAGPGGDEPIDALLPAIAVGGPVDQAQVITIATAAVCDPGTIRQLAADASATVEALRRLQPAEARIIDARMVAPLSLEEATLTVGLFSAHADANLLLVPDDRESDAHFGAPLSLDRPEQFHGHVAGEVASHAGLWTGMDESPLARGSAGVIGVGDPKVTIARSYVRILNGPPVPLSAAVANLTALPVPHGRAPSLDADLDVWSVARTVTERVPGLRHQPPPPYEPPVEVLDTRSAARRLAVEALRYLKAIPTHLRSGVYADLDQLAAEALTAAAGEEAAIHVSWTGIAPRNASLDVDQLLDSMRRQVARSQRIQDASLVSGDGWSDVIISILATADGGNFALGVPPPENHGVRAVVAELDLLAPESAHDAIEIAEELDAYSPPPDPAFVEQDREDVATDSTDAEDDEPPATQPGDQNAVEDGEPDTPDEAAPPGEHVRPPLDGPAEALPRSRVLLGEMVARVRKEQEAAESELQRALGTLREGRERLLNRSGNDLGALAWVMGTFAALLATVALVSTGAAEVVGADRWSPQVRTVLGLSLAAIAVVVGGGAIVAAFREHAEQRRHLQALLGLLLLTAVIAFGLGADVRLSTDVFGKMYGRELVLFITVLTALVLVARAAARLQSASGDAAARVVGTVALGYLSLSVVGGVVRPGGWYERTDASTRLRWGLTTMSLLGLAMVCLLAWILQRRLQERLRLRDEAERLRWETAVAVHASRSASALRAAHAQMLGTAVALARLLRKPFGDVPSQEDLRPPEPNLLCSANKVQIQRFDLDQRAFETLVARIRHQLARHGWLQQQYEAAVEAFRGEMASLYGTDPEEISRARPEDDPSSAPLDGSGRLPPGMRWDFVRVLFDGRLDAALGAALERLATDELLSGYIDRPGGRIDGSPSSIREFAAPLALASPPRLSAELFERQDLPTGDDPRAKLQPTLWWPKDAVEAPADLDIELMPTRVHDTGERGMVLTFVRTDWSVPMALSQLPVAAPGSRSQPTIDPDGPIVM